MFELNKENVINIVCGILLIVLIVVLIICLTRNDNFKDKMKNVKNEHNELEVCIFLDNPNCGFSRKMKALLEQNGMKIGNMNVTTKNIMTDGKELANKHNIQGTPGFVCFTMDKLTGKQKVKTSMGFKSLEQLEKELKEDSEEKGGNNGKEIVIIGMGTCPFCTKKYAFLEKNNIKYRKVAPNSQEGQSLIQKLGQNSGVPVCLVMNDGNIVKHKVGYHEDLSFYE